MLFDETMLAGSLIIDINRVEGNGGLFAPAMGFNDSEFRDSQYMRLKVLRTLRRKGLLDDRLEWTRS